ISISTQKFKFDPLYQLNPRPTGNTNARRKKKKMGPREEEAHRRGPGVAENGWSRGGGGRGERPRGVRGRRGGEGERGGGARGGEGNGSYTVWRRQKRARMEVGGGKKGRLKLAWVRRGRRKRRSNGQEEEKEKGKKKEKKKKKKKKKKRGGSRDRDR